MGHRLAHRDSTGSNPDKRYRIGATRCHFWKCHCRTVDSICHRHGEKTMSEWMDNQDVCRMLNISPRTLQTLRDNGTLAYSQINHKTYYRPEDVKRIVSIVEDRRKEARFKGKTI